MARFSLDNYLKVLFDFDEETDDFSLEDNEFVRIVAIKAENEDISLQKFFKHKSEIEEFIKKYKYNYHIYIGLATTKGQSGEASHMYKRKVLMLDFDRKDYPEYTDVTDFSTHIKSRIKTLFNHMIVDTGHGYHYYIATKRYKNNERMTTVNHELGEILGADLKATLITQIARIPTSINLKNKENQKVVAIVANNFESNPERFKPYNLLKIEALIEQKKYNKVFWEQVQRIPPSEFTTESSYYCIEAMIAEGVREGERNFALGRITNYLRDIKAYTEYNALRKVHEWNLRCQPPKPPEIVEQDFKAYWNGKYKLLGCTVPNERDQQTINRFCDRTLCRTVEKQTGNVKSEELMMDNNQLKDKVIQKLNGYHYMIISVLDFNSKGLSRKRLVEKLTNTTTKKCCITRDTLTKYLNDLLERNYITYNDTKKIYLKTEIANYGAGYTRYSYFATLCLINKLINKQEYLVYLCLARNLQLNRDVTYATLAKDLKMDEGNISRYIQRLNKAGIIAIERNTNLNGRTYNVYKIAS
ncbi:MAG: hypothetical protein IJC04_06855 [Oscillospiraceae bacterium]|nr:hypothetical protein [Oscillospiraceae bacterium]